MTFIRYAQNRQIGKPKKKKKLGARKPKGLNRTAKISKGHLCLREENLSFINNCIIEELCESLTNTLRQYYDKKRLIARPCRYHDIIKYPLLVDLI